jgi:hypothetical protein
MPLFHWSGTTRAGESMSGTLESPSKEQVLDSLRKQGIVVSTITEKTGLEASPVARRLKRVVFGLILLAGAAAMAMISKGARIECVRAGESYDCTIATTMAGFHTLYTENIHGVQSASQEHRAGSGGKRGSAASSRVVLTDGHKTLTTEWLQSVMPTVEQTMNVLNDHFAKRAASVGTWQIEAAPAAVALFLGLIGLWLVLRP